MVINGVFFRTRAGICWRDLPPVYGNWKTVYNRHRHWSLDGTWGRILDRLRAGCDEPVQDPSPCPIRSEEHTSELHSLTNLVCRLLLENKKKDTKGWTSRSISRTPTQPDRLDCGTQPFASLTSNGICRSTSTRNAQPTTQRAQMLTCCS